MALWLLSLGAKASGLFSAALAWIADPKNWPVAIIAVLVVVIWIQHNSGAGKDRTIASLQSSLLVVDGAFKSEKVSYKLIDDAITMQNAAVSKLAKASRDKLARSVEIAAGARRALADAQARANPVLAVQTAPTACLRADATDAAFLESLK